MIKVGGLLVLAATIFIGTAVAGDPTAKEAEAEMKKHLRELGFKVGK